MLHIQDEHKNIRTRTKVLRLYLQSMETNLQEMNKIQQTLQIQGVEDLRNRLQEVKNEHQRLNDRFEFFTTLSENVQDTNEMLLILQKKHEAVKDKCSELMTAFLEAKRKQRIKDEEEGGDEEYVVSNEEDEIVTNIPGIKPDLKYFLQASESEDSVSNNDRNLENPVIDWVEKLLVSDEENWKIVKEMKNKAIAIGAEVSRLLIRVMIMMSESEHAVEIFRIFRSALECVEADLKTMVINKFSSLTKIADEDLEEMKKEKKEEKKKVDEAQLEELLDKFLSEMLRLELVMKDPGVPDAKKLRGPAMEVLKERVEICEKCVDDLKEEVNRLGVLNKFVHEFGDLDGHGHGHGWLLVKKRMEVEINGVWTKLEDEPVEVEVDDDQTTGD